MIEGPTRGYETAQARLDGAASIAPSNASLNRARAATLIRLKRFEPASAVAEQAVTGNPEEPLGYELRLTALRARGRNAKALALFDDPGALALGEPNERIIAITDERIRQILTAAAAAAGLKKKLSPHWLRHAHGSHAHQRGAPAANNRDTLGHASLSTLDAGFCL
jgi:tetratricopeptide (TPR) repeat protein